MDLFHCSSPSSLCFDCPNQNCGRPTSLSEPEYPLNLPEPEELEVPLNFPELEELEVPLNFPEPEEPEF